MNYAARIKCNLQRSKYNSTNIYCTLLAVPWGNHKIYVLNSDAWSNNTTHSNHPVIEYYLIVK